MKKLLFFIAAVVWVLSASAESFDERIGAAMNSSDNFGLYDTYHSAP